MSHDDTEVQRVALLHLTVRGFFFNTRPTNISQKTAIKNGMVQEIAPKFYVSEGVF